MLKINGNTGISSDSRGLNFDLRLHKHPCFVYASSVGSDLSTFFSMMPKVPQLEPPLFTSSWVAENSLLHVLDVGSEHSSLDV